MANEGPRPGVVRGRTMPYPDKRDFAQNVFLKNLGWCGVNEGPPIPRPFPRQVGVRACTELAEVVTDDGRLLVQSRTKETGAIGDDVID